jgi:tetratricopeptide (TPR) repeat protein
MPRSRGGVVPDEAHDANQPQRGNGLPDGGRLVESPAGGVYDWLQRGMALLARGDAAAAATLLERVHAEDPTSASVLEALARSRYDAGQYEAARSGFAALVELSPDSDYAHFGLGLSLFRLGRPDAAEPHLALASVMRPGRSEYEQRLREVRATRAARREALGSLDSTRPGGPQERDQ